MDRSWTQAELAYFAGIIDGEGCIRLGNAGRKHIFGSFIQIGNTDPRLMEWIQTRFGGRISNERRSKSHWKNVYRWVTFSDDIEPILKAVLPYLLLKREQAELMLAYRSTLPAKVKTRHSTYKTDESVKAKRLAIHARMLELNRRGVEQQKAG